MRILKLFAATKIAKKKENNLHMQWIFQPYVNFQAFFTHNSKCIAICPAEGLSPAKTSPPVAQSPWVGGPQYWEWTQMDGQVPVGK